MDGNIVLWQFTSFILQLSLQLCQKKRTIRYQFNNRFKWNWSNDVVLIITHVFLPKMHHKINGLVSLCWFCKISDDAAKGSTANSAVACIWWWWWWRRWFIHSFRWRLEGFRCHCRISIHSIFKGFKFNGKTIANKQTNIIANVCRWWLCDFFMCKCHC